MTDWSTLKKLIWLRIIKGGGSALRTVTGAIVHVTNALALPAEALTVNVEPIQDLHGYDSPWPAGGGENLLYPGTDGTIYGVTKRVNSDGTVTFSGTATSVADFYFNGTTPSYTAYLLPNGTYHIEGSEGGSASTYDFFWIYQKDGATKYANGRDHTPVTVDGESTSRIFFRVYSGYTINLTVNLGLFNGDYQANAWSPYSNICPISGRTSATVTRTGVNVWDEETEIGGISSSTGQNEAIASIIRTKNYIPIFPDTTYFFYASDYPDANVKTRFYDESKNYIGYVQKSGTAVTPNTQFTTPTNARYLRFQFPNSYSTTYNHDISINYPSTDHDYHAYVGTTYAIQLGDTVYGGKIDVTGGKMVVTHIFFERNSSTMNNSEAYPGWIDAGVRSYGFTTRNLNNIVGSVGNAASINTSGISNDILYLSKGSYAERTQSEWIALAVDVQFVLPLPTPIEITLTPTQIDMLLGENNLWADAGDSTLTYYAEGEASTSEALGILLGGTYNNHGGADDVSDDEALGILLGGS